MASQFCPRCDKEFSGLTETLALAEVIKHVERAHPDYDPDWHVEIPSTEIVVVEEPNAS